MYDKLYEKQNDDIFPSGFPVRLDGTKTEPKELTTNARISHKSVIIEFSKSKLLKQEASENYIFFLILWLIVEREIKRAIDSDKITLNYYATTGREFNRVSNGNSKTSSR